MRLSRPASRFRGFWYVKSINGRPEPWPGMAPSRSYSSAIEKAKVTPWPHSGPRNDGPASVTCGAEPHSKRKAYIALGSNLGDRIDLVERACNEMSGRGIKITRTSSLWETEPMYVLDQDSFVNGACEVGQSPFCHLLLHETNLFRTVPAIQVTNQEE